MGKQLFGYSLLEDQEYILEQITELAEQEKADAVLIAGDLYDRSVPAGAAVLVMNRFLTGLAKRGIAVLAISGNHDSPERIHYLSDLMEKEHVYMQGIFTDPVRQVTLEDDFGPVHFYLMPFARPAQMCAALGTEGLSCGECVEEAVKRLPLCPKERNVLLIHQFVIGGGPEAWLKEEEGELSLGGIDGVPADIFQDLDYVAMGHIHRPQKLGRETIRYAGSPLCYSFSEVKYTKSVPVVELGRKGEAAVRLCPLVPKREMAVLKGTMGELTSGEMPEENRERYLQIILQEDGELLDPMQTLRQYYPRVMQILFQRSMTERETEKITAGELKQTGPEELFRRFYEDVSGREFTAEKRQVMKDILREIREEEQER